MNWQDIITFDHPAAMHLNVVDAQGKIIPRVKAYNNRTKQVWVYDIESSFGKKRTDDIPIKQMTVCGSRIVFKKIGNDNPTDSIWYHHRKLDACADYIAWKIEAQFYRNRMWKSFIEMGMLPPITRDVPTFEDWWEQNKYNYIL